MISECKLWSSTAAHMSRDTSVILGDSTLNGRPQICLIQHFLKPFKKGKILQSGRGGKLVLITILRFRPFF